MTPAVVALLTTWLVVIGAGMVGALLPRPRRHSVGGNGRTTQANTLPQAIGQQVREMVGSVRIRQQRRRPLPAAAVAPWCDALARRLRSGETVRTVLLSERPDDAALRIRTDPLRRRLERGASVADAVEHVADVSPHPHLDLLWSVLGLASDFGGSTADAIDRVATALRLRAADAQERSAHSAQARLSAHVLTVVPLVVLALLLATDPDVRDVVGRPTGSAIVGVGLAANLAGWSWMQRIVRNGTT